MISWNFSAETEEDHRKPHSSLLISGMSITFVARKTAAGKFVRLML
jgi:hypothetical protein